MRGMTLRRMSRLPPDPVIVKLMLIFRIQLAKCNS